MHSFGTIGSELLAGRAALLQTTVTASTSTLTDTATDTVTSTDTSTTTETTTTVSTSTIPFVPVQTSLPGSSYSGSGGPVLKRDLSEAPAAKRDLLDVNIDLGGATSPKQYPKGITCYKHKHGHCVQAVTTVTSTKTVTPKPRATTSVESSTVYPSATIIDLRFLGRTITTMSTETTTTTTTETTTSTATATTTQAPNCNANNFSDNIGSTPIDDGYASAGQPRTYISTTTASALTCCLAALAVPGSELFFFAPSSTTGNCIVVATNAGTCSSQDTNLGNVFTGTRTPQLVVGNGGCGEFTNIIPE